MKASYQWLQWYVDAPLPKADELATLLTEHVFEVEDVEKVGDDTVFDFKVLPDRAHYLLGHRGLAKEIGVIAKLPYKEAPAATIADAGADGVAARVDNEKFCRRIVARRFDNASGTTPEWMEQLLEAIGQRSINLHVDVSNYVMFDLGQPSHMLDADKVRGEIVIRSAKAGETIEILGGKVLTLTADDVVVADDEGPLEIAGVKGGERAAITADTKNVIVHAGNYDPTMVRRTSTRLDLRSDASKRFENELAPEYAERGMDYIGKLMMEICPDAKAGPILDLFPAPPATRTIIVTAAEVSRMLGVEVDGDEIVDVLERMGCAVSRDGESLEVVPPADRFDLVIPEDIADEIGRMRGYNAMPGVLPADLPAPQPQDPLFYYGELVKNALVGRGYDEVLLYSFGQRGAFEIAKPLASDKGWLRESLAERMEEKLAFNVRNADLLGLDAIRLCEVGQIFPETGERSALALGVAFTRKRKGESPSDVIREDLHALSEALGVEVPDTTDTGAYGAICEIDLTALIEKLPAPGALSTLGFTHLAEGKRFARIVPYPFISRDIAVFVPDGVAVEDAHEVIRQAAGELRVRSWLFDEFVKQVDDVVQHSYAFRVVFQSPERTLEDKEINTVMERVNEAVAAKGWTVR